MPPLLTTLSGSWAAHALLALVAMCAYTLSMKRLLGDEDEEDDPVLLSGVVMVSVGLGALALALARGELAPGLARLRPALGLALLDVALYALAPVLYYSALKRLPVSQVVVQQALIGVFALIGGAALGLEAASPARFGGAALVVGATLLARSSPGEGGLTRHSAMLLASAALYGAAALADRELVAAVGLSVSMTLTVAFLLPGLAMLAWALLRAARPGEALRRALGRRTPFVNAAVLGLAYAAIYRAYGLGGPASGVTLILAAEAVFVVALAALLLRERERWPQRLLAGALATLGVALVG